MPLQGLCCQRSSHNLVQSHPVSTSLTLISSSESKAIVEQQCLADPTLITMALRSTWVVLMLVLSLRGQGKKIITVLVV